MFLSRSRAAAALPLSFDRHDGLHVRICDVMAQLITQDNTNGYKWKTRLTSNCQRILEIGSCNYHDCSRNVECASFANYILFGNFIRFIGTVVHPAGVAMATLPKRVVKLEEVVLGSVATGALVTRVQHLEVCCLGSAAAGPLPQRLDKLEEATGCTAGDGAAVAVDAAPAPEADEVADAAASTQATESHPWALVIVQICLYSMFLQPSKIG